jgi:spore coat polysaccharide biosynthesis protein SpsF
MLKNLGIVQANFHSPRFRSLVMRKLDGRSLIEWVIRRVTDAMRLNGVIVVASGVEDREMVHRLIPHDIPIFFGQSEDSLALIAKAVEQYPAEGVVRVDGDNPFVDPCLIDRLVTTAEAMPNSDYVGFALRDGRPAFGSPVSIYAEWFRMGAVWKAHRAASDESERGHAARYLLSHPEKFNIRLIPAPAAIDRDDVRLTVDIEEDWDHVLAIVEALGSEGLDWQRIARLLDQQPALRSRMAVLNRTHHRMAVGVH